MVTSGDIEQIHSKYPPSLVAQKVKNIPAIQETQVQSLGQENPLEKYSPPEKYTTPVFLPGESHGQRSLAGYSPRSRKESETRLND